MDVPTANPGAGGAEIDVCVCVCVCGGIYLGAYT